MKKKNSKTSWLIFIGIVLAIAVIIFCIWLPIQNKTKAPDSNQNVNTNNSNGSFDQKDNSNINTNSADNTDQKDTNQNQNTNTRPTLNASDYYNQGLVYTSQKQYEAAINSFTKAIEINPKEPDYYNKKAEAEVLVDRKQDAINTIKAGLVQNPNDTNLQNKLNILETVVQ